MDKSKVCEIAFNIIKDSFGWADNYKDGEHSIFINGVVCMADYILSVLNENDGCECDYEEMSNVEDIV